MPTMYLCGATGKLLDTDLGDWRESASSLLPGWTILDPMRRTLIGSSESEFDAIVEADIRDINEADALLVNASKPSWTTGMEIRVAWFINCTIYAFGCNAVSPWLSYHCQVFKTLEEAVNLANAEWLLPRTKPLIVDGDDE